ncbi:MAG TPA: squalene synthase HpnC [Gammaproteobacteria bacterium]|nr:squalene synthase HpnC [Gammaproteobacteria bacterium]
MQSRTLEQAYQHCQTLTGSHYENFPVASVFLPRNLRKPVSAIYTFARMADDIADEGNLHPEERTDLLNKAEQSLQLAAAGRPENEPVFIALSDVLKSHPGLLEHLLDLLIAFNMDVHKKRYTGFSEVLEYCRFSANPIGRMLLVLFNEASDKNLEQSDSICSALQIINFLQDIYSDYTDRDRIYLAQDEMEKFNITEADLGKKQPLPHAGEFLDMQIQRVFTMLRQGSPLGVHLPGRVGMELRMVTLGGWQILNKIHKRGGCFFISPRLGKPDWLWIMSRGLTRHFQVYSNSIKPFVKLS